MHFIHVAARFNLLLTATHIAGTVNSWQTHSHVTMYLSFSNTIHRPITPLLLYYQPCSIYWCTPSPIGHRPPGVTCSTVPSISPLQKHNAFVHIKPKTLCKLLLIIRIQSLSNIRVIALPVCHLPCSATVQTPNNQVLFVRNQNPPDHAVLPRPL